MPAVLSIIDGPQAGATCELRVGQRAVLGRGEDSDFHILDSWASRNHCAVIYDADGLRVEDLSTKNGTYLSGRRVDKVRLHDGALLQVGTTTLQVLIRPTRSTVAVPTATLPRRAARAGVLVLVPLLALVAVAAVGYYVFVRPARSRAKGGEGTGVSWSKPDEEGGGGILGFLGAGPRQVTIAIGSEPSGATVFIDDEFRGATPLTGLKIMTGEHTIRVHKAGYQELRAPLVVSGKKTEPFHLALKLAEKGSLLVRSTPDGAEVFLDDEYRGKTPLRIHDLDPHTYVLRVRKANFADWLGDAALKPAEVTTVDAVLSKREVGYYVKGLEKDPNNVSYHTELAHLYLLERKPDLCIQHLTLGIDITVAGRDTTRPQPYTRRLVWLIAKIYFNDYIIWGDAATVQKMQGQIDAMLASAAGRHPGSSTILEIAQGLYKRSGTPERLVPLYLKQAEAQPTTFSHYAQAVALLQAAGRHAEATQVLEKALKAIPNNYLIHLELGRAHLKAKKAGVGGARERAIASLNAALKLCTDEGGKREIRRLLGKATQ